MSDYLDLPVDDCPIEITAAGEPLFEGVPFGAVGTVEVPADDCELEVRPATPDVDSDEE